MGDEKLYDAFREAELLRARIATGVMCGFAANPEMTFPSADDAARLSIRWADALLVELTK